jgi:hypothetical protein
MSTVTTRHRVDTAERWQAALERAISQGLETFVAADTGDRFVTSASRLDLIHRSDGDRCSCPAALGGDPICQHRAVVRFVTGRLDPEPPTARCPTCYGARVLYDRELERIGALYPPCQTCKGAGRVPVTILAA